MSFKPNKKKIIQDNGIEQKSDIGGSIVMFFSIAVSITVIVFGILAFVFPNSGG